MTVVLDAHFHCPDCGPLQRGVTRAICGQIIPPPEVGDGPVRVRKRPPCKSALRAHKKGHRR
ncbi:hypothetical protein JL475_00340 [Streptomyces sp. M2CJ-2]|uniref:hypothetical protein n=1 Tax=Streptomyces sp. M2CJ-2 TaxID=2803948 RepID=UPI001924AB6D|nr:hypothetical protein [Streptomyces sp. M2CJ-2]MBL3664494.1 hypothetical protein [Streptomyces sp. M2CJ-2]